MLPVKSRQTLFLVVLVWWNAAVPLAARDPLWLLRSWLGTSTPRTVRHAAYFQQQLDTLRLEAYSQQQVAGIVREACDRILRGQPAAQPGKLGPAVGRLQQLLLDLPGAKVPGKACALDPALRDTAASQGTYFVALNLHNSADVIPHQALQLLLVSSLFPAGNIAVSIYESGSEDASAEWLALLARLLALAGVPHRVACSGEARLPAQHRIQFLAQMRDHAMEPLHHAQLLSTHAGRLAASQGGVTSDQNSTLHQRSVPLHFPADRVIFINDVYFCANDILRLTQHAADISCGMDFVELRGLDGVFFYDQWVARDVDGVKIPNDESPYVRHEYSRDRAANGLPFPATCCWNGMAVLNASAFLHHGIRFRSRRENECDHSECSYLCEDFIRAGLRRVVVDPGVRQAYEPGLAARLYTMAHQPNGDPFIPLRAWRQVLAAPPIDPALLPPAAFNMECCADLNQCAARDILTASW